MCDFGVTCYGCRFIHASLRHNFSTFLKKFFSLPFLVRLKHNFHIRKNNFSILLAFLLGDFSSSFIRRQKEKSEEKISNLFPRMSFHVVDLETLFSLSRFPPTIRKANSIETQLFHWSEKNLIRLMSGSGWIIMRKSRIAFNCLSSSVNCIIKKKREFSLMWCGSENSR